MDFLFRALFALLTCTLLSGCLSSGSTAVFDSVQRLVDERRVVKLDRALVERTDAGILKVGIDRRRPVFFELHAIHPTRYVLDFKSVDGAFLQLYNGHIRGTYRLGPELLTLAPLADDPFDHGFTNTHPAKTYFWSLSVPTLGSSLVAESRYRFDGSESVHTLYGTWKARIVSELWEIPELNYRAENRYWIDPQGLVIKSVQAPVPLSATFNLKLESYRPVTVQ